MHELFDQTIQLLVTFINQIGYFGIFLGMFFESTIVPIPSELVMIPAGISVAAGTMNVFYVMICGVLGNLLGAIFSYYLAKIIGRKILFYVGKYFFVNAQTIIKIENFFQKHGNISVFIGRLVLGARHFISLFAGIANMRLSLFSLYTTLGSTIWTGVLVLIGYLIGENQEMIKEYLNIALIACLVACLLILAIYIFFKPARQ